MALAPVIAPQGKIGMVAESALVPTRFVRWWLGELRACIPGVVSRAIFGGKSRVVVTLGCESAGIAVQRNGKLRDIGPIQADDVQSMRKAMRRLIAGNKLDGAPVTLCLAEDKILRPRIELPVEAADNLRDVVAIDMDRHTPFSAADVLFDLRVNGVNAERQRLTVDLIVARKSDADDALETVRAMGLEPDILTVASEIRAGRDSNLLPVDQRPRRSRLLAYANGALALVCCVLVAVAVSQTVDRKERTVAAFQEKLNELRTSSGEADRLEERLERLIALSDQLVESKSVRASMVEIIDEITQRIPDQSWLTNYAYHDGTIEMTGYSDNPSNLLRQLESSEMFSQVQFSAPVTMDSRVGRERFNISMKLAVTEEKP